MWIEWFVRCSARIAKWPLRVVCDECKRHRYKLSFSPLLFINNRKIDSIRLHEHDGETAQRDERNYRRNDYQRQSTCFASSVLGALASAAVLFSWEKDGIDDEEL